MIRLALATAAAALAAALVLPAALSEPEPHAPLLAELFTSQGCSSCPPAERLFASLAHDPDYVTIEWHVDYWDDLVHGGSRWQDPFSKPEFTERQRAYNSALTGKRNVYTPQGVLAGSREFVGSRPAEFAFARPLAAAPTARLKVADGAVTVSGKGAGEVWFVRLQSQQSTEVKGGENKGKQLAGRNIGRELKRLGSWSGKTASYKIPALKTGETCALFVQPLSKDDEPLPVLGAAYCS